MLATDTVVRPSCVAEMRDACGPLFAAHHAELRSVRPDGLGLDLNVEAFAAAEQRRDLVCRVAWAADQPVGYAVAAFYDNPMCRGDLVLLVSAVFVAPAARSTDAWPQLADALRDAADAANARLVWSVYAGTAAAVVLERRCGPPRELTFYER